MSWLRPDVQEERWLAAACPARGGGWRGTSLLKRGALFALGTLASALTVAVLLQLQVPNALQTAASCLLIAAECLVIGGRLFGCGFEEALESAALLIAGYALTKGGSETAQFLAGAAALALAGLRLLNPFLTALAAVALTGGLRSAVAPEYSSFLVAAAALALSRRTYRRPSHDRMLGWLVVVMPVCGCWWFSVPARIPLPAAALLPAVFGGVSLAAGIRGRVHAPLVAAMLSAVGSAYALRAVGGLAFETRLILGGGATLALAVGLERWLGPGRAGITARAPATKDEALDLLELAGSVRLAGPDAAPPDRFRGGGGTFGGGGAGGRY